MTSCGNLLVAAEGPFLRFYDAQSSECLASRRVFKAQAVHGISTYSETYDDVIRLVVWGGCLIRALEVTFAPEDAKKTNPIFRPSEVARASDWILDLAARFSSLEDAAEGHDGICVAVTAHNALIYVTIHRGHADEGGDRCVSNRVQLYGTFQALISSAACFAYQSRN